MLLCCPIVPAICQEQLWPHLRRHTEITTKLQISPKIRKSFYKGTKTSWRLFLAFTKWPFEVKCHALTLKCSYAVLLYRQYARNNFSHTQEGTEMTSKSRLYKRSEVKFQVLTLNAAMLFHCTGNVPGTTLVTPKETQRSLQNSKFCQKHGNSYIKIQKRLGGCFWPLQNGHLKSNFTLWRSKCSYVVLLYWQYPE